MNFKILVTFVFVNAFALQSFCQHSSDVMDNDDNDSLPQDDVSVRDEGARRKLGPFNMSLESGATRLFLTWSVFIEDDLDDRMNEIEFSLFTNSKKINWVAFGFAKGNDFRKADWFVAWKSIRKGRIYSKVKGYCMMFWKQSLFLMLFNLFDRNLYIISYQFLLIGQLVSDQTLQTNIYFKLYHDFLALFFSFIRPT